MRRQLAIAASLFALACAGADLVLPGEGEPASLEVVQGGGQTGRVNEPLAQPLMVRVLDSNGRPLSDVPVSVVVPDGDGVPEVVPDSAMSDADGMASFRVVLGTRIGETTLQVQVLTAGGTRTLSESVAVTALAADANGLSLVSGDGQSGSVGSTLSQALVVEATDAFGNPIPGVTVRWSVEGGGSVSATETVTDADGRASVTRTLGDVAGEQSTVASAEGLVGSPLRFGHVATAGSAARVVAVSGDGQSAVVGTKLGSPLVVQVLDAEGNPVPERAVTWVVLLGGGVADPVNTTTDDNGRASTRLTLGPDPGTNTVSAVVSGIGVAGFTAGGTPDPSTVPARIERVSGDGQTATVGATLSQPLSVKVTAADGSPVSGVSVSWTAQNGGSVSSATSVTGSNGVAQVFRTLGSTPGTYGTTASVSGVAGSLVSFTATGAAGAPPTLALVTQPASSAVNGATLSRQPVVQLRDPSGQPLARSGVEVRATLASGNGQLRGTTTRSTGADGRAAFGDLAIQGAAGSYTIIFSASGYTGVVSEPVALSAAPTTTSIVSDNPDPSTAGQAVTVRFRVSAENGTPAGTVTVSAGSATCSRALTDGAGECTLVLTATGTVGITASYSGSSGYSASSARTDHEVRAPQPAATTTAIVSDDPDPSSVGAAVQVRVRVISAAGSPAGSVQVSAGDGVSCTTTVSAGQCALTFTTPGDRTITATYGGSDAFAPSSDTESHTVQHRPLAPTVTRIVADDPDPSNPGGTVTVRYTVSASSGTPAGVVTVRVNSGESCTGSVADGQCPVDIVAPGEHTIAAAYAGSDGFAASTSESVPHTVKTPATPILVVRRQPSSTALVNQPLDRQPEIQLEDGEGHDLKRAGVTVSASVATGPGPLQGTTTATTDGNGRAQFDNLALGGSGTTTLRFSADGFTGVTSDAIEVSRAESTTRITSDDPDPSQVGQAVTIGFSVTSAGSRPEGTVTVSAGAGESCSASTATGACSITFATAGTRTLTASYEGSATAAPSSATAQHTVATPAPAATTTTITADTPDPSAVGQAVTIQVSVTSGAGTPAGTVTVNASTGESCSTTAPTGDCSITFASPGGRTLVATYGGGGGFAGSASTAASHDVTAPNNAPVAQNDVATTSEDASVIIPVLANDSDADGDNLQLADVSTPQHGAVTATADGQLQYTPESNFSGSDSFTYTISDGEAVSAPATVSVTVTPVNDPPGFTLRQGDVTLPATSSEDTVTALVAEISAGPSETGQAVSFAATVDSADNELFTDPPAIDSTGTLTLTPSGVPGSATVSVVARDNGGTLNGGLDVSTPQQFTIELTPTP